MNKKLLLRYRMLQGGSVAVWFQIIDDIEINSEVTGNPQLIFFDEAYFKNNILDVQEEINLLKEVPISSVVYNNVLDVNYNGNPQLIYFVGDESKHNILNEDDIVRVARTFIINAIFETSKIIETQQQVNLCKICVADCEILDELVQVLESGSVTKIQIINENLNSYLIKETISDGNRVAIDTKAIFEIDKTILNQSLIGDCTLISIPSLTIKKTLLQISDEINASKIIIKRNELLKDLITAALYGGICSMISVENASAPNYDLIEQSEKLNLKKLSVLPANEVDNINIYTQDTVKVALIRASGNEIQDTIRILQQYQGGVNKSINIRDDIKKDIYIISTYSNNLSLLYFIQANYLKTMISSSEECWVDVLDEWIFPIQDGDDLLVQQCFSIEQQQENLIWQ